MLDYLFLATSFLSLIFASIYSLSNNQNKSILNKLFIFLWSLFILSMLISGYYHGISIFLLIPFSFFFFVNIISRNYNYVYKLFCNGIILSLIILTIGALFFCPLNTHIYYIGRYSGSFTNPNIYELFLLPVYCVFLIKLHISFEKSLSIVKPIFPILGFGLCSSLIIMTECRTALVSAF